MPACTTCGADVLFAVTTNGKRMPIDADPVPDGNLIVNDGRVRVATEADLGRHGPRFRSHFASCKQAAQHRRAR